MDTPPPTTAAAVAVAVAGPPLLRHIVYVDTAVSRHLHSLAKPIIPRSLFLLFELSADFRFFFPVSLALYLARLPSLEVIQRQFLAPLLLGSLLDLGLVGLLKILVRRSRPSYNHQESMSVAVAPDHFSFPSGHASRVCFVASLFHFSTAAVGESIKDLLYWSGLVERLSVLDDEKMVELMVLVVWSWAVATSVSRVLLGRHFVFDVFVGAWLGVLEGIISFRFLRL